VRSGRFTSGLIALTLGIAAGVFQDAQAAPTQTHPSTSADEFVDSVGVNVHMSYSDTPYSDVEAIERGLLNLGVRHIRDGLVPGRPDQWVALARLADRGVAPTLIMGDPSGRRGEPVDLVAVLSATLRGRVEAVEGPNEYDLTADRPDWAGPLRAYQDELFGRMGGALPVLAPSLGRAEHHGVMAAAGPVSADLGNIHPYPGGEAPDDLVEIARQIALANSVATGRPVWATETGYHNGVDDQPAVSERAAGVYMPRLLLAFFAGGVSRTYLYELIDIQRSPVDASEDGNWGLLRRDFSPKPAFKAVRRLLRVLDDGGGGRREGGLRYRLSGDSTDLQRLLLRRCDGTFSLALWRARSVYDTATGSDLPFRSSPIRVMLARPSRTRILSLDRIRPLHSGSATSAVTIDLGPEVRILEVAPPWSRQRVRRGPNRRPLRSLRASLRRMAREVRARGAGCLDDRVYRLPLGGRAPGRYRASLTIAGRKVAGGKAVLRSGEPASLRMATRRRVRRRLRPGTSLRLVLSYAPIGSPGGRVATRGVRIGP